MAAESDLPWFQWYPGDFLRRSRGWPLIAKAIYRELYDIQWDRGHLPADTEQLRKLVGASTGQWRKAWPHIEEFFPIDGDFRSNFGLEVIRGEARLMRESRRQGARKTNGKRWGSNVSPINGGSR